MYSRSQPQQQLQALQQTSQQSLISQQINQGTQQLHQNLNKNVNVNTGVTNDFPLGQSQNVLNRNYQGTTTNIISGSNGTNSTASSWSAQNTTIPQGVQRTVATTPSTSTNQSVFTALSQDGNNLSQVIILKILG